MNNVTNQNFPDFFLIGAMKSGTTTVRDYLAVHPDIFMCFPKEPGYFSQPEVYEKGDQWYLDLFSDASANQLLGDASTCYSRWPTFGNVPERISQRKPDAKIIYIVRDPVDRAYSHYRHRMQEVLMFGGEQISFKEAIKTDEEMLYAGKYHVQLGEYLKFFSQDNIFICDFESLKRDPKKMLTDIFNFIGVSVFFEEDSTKASNQAGDGLSRKLLRDKLKTIRRLPVIKPLLDLLPSDARQGIYAKTYRLGNKIKPLMSTGKKHLATIAKPDESDKMFLADYYREDAKLFSELTQLDTKHWSVFQAKEQ